MLFTTSSSCKNEEITDGLIIQILTHSLSKLLLNLNIYCCDNLV